MMRSTAPSPQLRSLCLHRCAAMPSASWGVSAKRFTAMAYPAARLQARAASSVPEQAKDGNITRAESPSRFPYTDHFRFRGVERPVNSSMMLEVLEPLMSPERVAKIQQVCAHRTFNVLPIVEGCVNYGNLSAVCRTSEALGFGAVHVIDNEKQKMKQSARTTAGADKWLDVVKWRSTRECLQHAKEAGYQVAVTHLREDAVNVSEIDWSKPTAVLLGNEAEGVSKEAVEMADCCTIIPMDGFVESFNISVAAALAMYEARTSRERLLGSNADLTEEEQRVLRAVMSLKHQSSVVRIDTDTYMAELLSRLDRDGSA